MLNLGNKTNSMIKVESNLSNQSSRSRNHLENPGKIISNLSNVSQMNLSDNNGNLNVTMPIKIRSNNSNLSSIQGSPRNTVAQAMKKVKKKMNYKK
jgi:hypothetical protein